MLHFVLGVAGTGKTSCLMDRLEQVVDGGGKAVLLVPEQYSFEGEKQIHRRLGAGRALQVEVLSFTRLCDAIFREYGGLSGVAVSQTGRYLLMSVVVGELRDTLRVYRRSAGNTAFLETLLAACGEFKTAGIAPARLQEIAAAADGALGEKLTDLSAVYSAYQAMLERGYVDPEDNLLRACRLLEQHDFFAGKSLFVDGFTTFMAAEFELLGLAVRGAQDAWFAFTADSTDDAQGGVGVFSPAKRAMRRLRRYADQGGVPTASPTVLDKLRRYHSDELGALARGFLQPLDGEQEAPAQDIRLHAAADPYREIEYVAANIARLVREDGYRYRDVAVVARDTGPYLRALQSVFRRVGLPYFADERRDVESMPLAGGLLQAVEAVRANFDTQAVLGWAKSPLAGLDPRQVAALENYCYCWSVRGQLWLEPMRNNPRGLSETLDLEDEAALAAINATRLSVTEPLLRLRDALTDADGRRFARGIHDFLQQVGAAGHLLGFAKKLPDGERETFLDESAQLWDALMDILDVFGTVLGAMKVPRNRLCELLSLSLRSAEIGLVPQHLDEVLVGTANRIRPGDVRAVFVIGAVDGQFPADCGSAGVFTDAERQQMIELGAEISPPAVHQAVLEKYFAYYALTLPSEQLYISWHETDTSGAQRLPSLIIEQVRGLFPAIEPDRLAFADELTGDRAAFALLARGYREDSPATAALLAYFADRGALVRMDRAASKPPHALRDPALAGKLFGSRMRLSPSRVERYYRCPYSYFIQDGLRLRPRVRVEFSPLESGSVIHHVLQVMVQRHGRALHELGEKELSEQVRALIFDYLRGRVEDMDKLPVRFKYLFGRLTATLVRLLQHLGGELAQSAFEPAHFELPIGPEGVQPLELQTADGATVLVEGVVDRVDIMEKNGRRYVRVVDYKSGGKDFNLNDILYGLNLQMLVYLFTIAENGTGDLAGAIPAGVLYMPVLGRYVNAGRDTAAEDVEKQLAAQWKMSGLLLEDQDALFGMEQDLKGVYIPAKVTKDGKLDAKSALAGKAEMGRLSRKVRELIGQMAEGLRRGRIAATPVDHPDYNPCQYCDYASVCGFEPGDRVREIAKLDRAQVFQKLREEQDV